MSIELFHNPSYDFIGKRRWAYLLSALFIAVGFLLGRMGRHD